MRVCEGGGPAAPHDAALLRGHLAAAVLLEQLLVHHCVGLELAVKRLAVLECLHLGVCSGMGCERLSSRSMCPDPVPW